jgi:anti-sigma B factor antagonist
MKTRERLDISERNGVVVASLLDRKLLDREALAELGAAFGRIACGAQATVVLDCSRVEHLSSAALKSILRLHKVLKKHGGGLTLCGLQPTLAEVFRITRLDQLLVVKDSLEAALATVSARAVPPVPACPHCAWPCQARCLLCGRGFCEDHGSPYSRLCRRHRWVGWLVAIAFIAGMILLRRLLRG